MLTTTSKYGLRVLVALVGTEGGGYVPGDDLAERTGVPRGYLAKVLQTLGTAGLVEAVRGRGGGYRLTRSADAVRLVDAVEAFEGVRTHPACLLGVHEVCSDDHPCSAHEAFREVRALYIEFLETTSIAQAASMEVSSSSASP
jgi:Rrf2 family protein